MIESQEPAQAPSSGAEAALAGYEYQLDVSILAALRLMLITKSATRIVLEPANEEDLQVDLDDQGPDAVEPSANLVNGYKLVIQVKYTSGDPWSLAKFKALLNHGKRRKKAREHLDDPSIHYLLVTNADATGEARKLLVGDFEEASEADDFPPSLKSVLKKSPEGRVAIWGGLRPKLLAFEIKDIFGTALRVPLVNQYECLDHLRKEAKRRMRGSVSGVWTREDLVATIRSHGGHLASAAELEAFVPPSNFEGMTALLRDRNAIVIRGPSGTGKTIAALALCDVARKEDGQLDIVKLGSSSDPSSASHPIETGPKLIYVEDPWGSVSLLSGSAAWTDQLPRLLGRADANRRYVVTSRSDMLSQANATESLERWSIELNADHYQDGEFARIYDRRMDLLAIDRQPLALEFRADVLETLQTPLELDLFFTALADPPLAGESNIDLYHRIIGLAHRDAVEGVVEKYLQSTDSNGTAAMLWALLVARGQFERAQLTALQSRLRKVAAITGLGKLVDRLVATRHLRQPDSTVSFAHPSVRAGFEKFVREHWDDHVGALEAMIGSLTDLAGDHRAWGLESAARILLVARQFQQGLKNAEPLDVPAPALEAIDAWLEGALLQPSSDFPALIQLAADIGTTASNLAELSRWFMNGTRRGAAYFIADWKPPAVDDNWYQRISSDPRSRLLAGRFVRELLPTDRGDYGRSFVQKLDRISTELTPYYLEAAQWVIGMGHEPNTRVIAMGAVRDLAKFGPIVMKAVADLEAMERRGDADGSPNWHQIEDGEADKAYADYHTDYHNDDGAASEELVRAYVHAMRVAGRWRELVVHRQLSPLATTWSRSVRDDPSPTQVEVGGLLDAMRGAPQEPAAWMAAGRHWHDALEERLTAAMLAVGGNDRLRAALVECAVVHHPAALTETLDRTLRKDTLQFVRFVVDIRDVADHGGEDEKAGVAQFLVAASAEVRDLFHALNPASAPHMSQRTDAMSRVVEELPSTAEPELLGRILPILLRSGGAPSDAVRRLLNESQDRALACQAAEAAVAIGNEELIDLALTHPRADARQIALEHRLSMCNGIVPDRLVTFAHDKGCRVRTALLDKIVQYPSPEHINTLLILAHDTWSDAEPHYDGTESFPVARAAVAALLRYPHLDDAVGKDLLGIGRSTPDNDLARVAFEVAASRCGASIRSAIFDVSNERELDWKRVYALQGLSAAQMVERELLDRITDKWLLSVSSRVAIVGTALLCTHLPVAEAVKRIEVVSHSNKRRALILVGAHVLKDRDLKGAATVLDLLEPKHAARELLSSRSLPVSVLNDLGTVQIRRYVQAYLSDYFLLAGE